MTGDKIGLGLAMTIIRPAVNAGKDWNNQELGNSVNHYQLSPGGRGSSVKGGQCGQRAAVDQHRHEIFGVESRVLLCASHTWLMTRRVLWLSPLVEDDKFWTGRLREAPCHVGSTCLRLLLASPRYETALNANCLSSYAKGASF